MRWRDDDSIADLAKIRSEERARRDREEREQRAARRRETWGNQSKFSVRDHLSFWAEVLIEAERERRAERDYRRASFKEMIAEQRNQLDEEMRPPKLEQEKQRGQVIEHSVLDELRQQRERDQGRGRSLSDEF
jgi:hypothetical protein